MALWEGLSTEQMFEDLSSSETKEHIQAETRALLNEARLQIKEFHNAWAEDLYKKAVVDYNITTEKFEKAMKGDNKITPEELHDLKWDVDGVNEAAEEELKMNAIDWLSQIIEEKELWYKYELIIPIFFGIDIGSEFIQDMQKEIEDTWKISYASLKALNDLSLWKFNISDSIQNEMNEKIEAWFKNWNILKTVKSIGKKEWQELYDYNVALRIWLSSFLEKSNDITNLENFLFKYMDTMFPPAGCDPETSLMITTVRAQYLENKDINIRSNLENYYVSEGVSQEEIKALSDELWKLHETLKKWDCTLNALWIIQEFNEKYFSQYSIKLSKKWALEIIWSVIELKRADIDVSKWEANRVEDEEEREQIVAELSDDERDIAMQEKTLQTMSELSEDEFKIFLKFGEYFWKEINTQDKKILAYILEKPEERLQEISSSKQLNTILKNFSRVQYESLSTEEKQSELGKKIQKISEWIERTNISDIQSSALTPENISLFHGKFNDFSIIEWYLLADPKLIQHVLLQQEGNDVLAYLCQNEEWVKACYNALHTLTSYNTNWSENIQNIQGRILSQLPVQLRIYISQKWGNTNIPVTEADLKTPIFTKSDFREFVSELKAWWNLNIEKRNKMNNFLSLMWIWEYQDEITDIIEKWYWGKLRKLRFDTNTLDIAVMLLEQDPTRIHDIPVNLRWNKNVVATLLEHGEAYYEYIEITNLNTALKIVEALRETWLPITGKMRTKLWIIFANISDTQKREFLDNKEERELLKWVLDSIEEYENGVSTAWEISRELQTHEVHSKSIVAYLKEQWFSKNQEWEKFVKELLSGWGRLSYESAYRMLESQELSPEEIGEHLRNILEITRKQLEEEITELSGAKLVWNPKSFEEIGNINSEGDFSLDTWKIESSFKKFRKSQENLFSSESEALQAYLEFHKIRWTDRTNVIKTLTKSAEIAWTIALLEWKSNKELATLAQQGQLDDYVTAYRKSYFSWENPEDIFKEIQKTRKQEDTAKSLWDEYHTDEDITTILEQWVFTPSEISDLTPEEVNILTWDNEMALENLMNMHETLERLNLEFIWKHRHKYLIAMWNPDIKNDAKWSIDGSELLKILNYTLKVIWKESHYSNIDGAKNAIKTINDSHSNALKKNSFGRSDIEQIFWNKWYIDENIGLNITSIRDTSRHISE